MPCGIRPSNVRVCHFTTRAERKREGVTSNTTRRLGKQSLCAVWENIPKGCASTKPPRRLFWSGPCFHGCMTSFPTRNVPDVAGHSLDKSLAWVKADLHLHTAEDPLDEIDYTAVELLEYAASLGFRVLAITLHDKVFDDDKAFARAQELGILLLPAAELRIQGADTVLLLNISPDGSCRVAKLVADDLRQPARPCAAMRCSHSRRTRFIGLGGSIGARLRTSIWSASTPSNTAISMCRFLNPNARCRSGGATADRRNRCWPLPMPIDGNSSGSITPSSELQSQTRCRPPSRMCLHAIRAHHVHPAREPHGRDWRAFSP